VPAVATATLAVAVPAVAAPLLLLADLGHGEHLPPTVSRN
jgi:hypothetical protein